MLISSYSFVPEIRKNLMLIHINLFRFFLKIFDSSFFSDVSIASQRHLIFIQLTFMYQSFWKQKQVVEQQIQQMSQIKKQQNKLYGQEQEQHEAQKEAHNQTLTQKNDKKKKRKKKIKRPRHPPEYYEQLRKQKQNRKREEQWNARFNLGSIPDMYQTQKNGKKKERMKSLKRFESNKQKEAVYKTFDIENPNQTKTKPSKSFNIRIMNKKQQAQQLKKEPGELIKSHAEKNRQEEQMKRKQIQKQEKQKQKQKQIDQLIEEVNKVYQQLKFAECHKDLLIDIIKNSNEKTLKSFIHAEIAKLKGKTSFCSLLEASIQKRQSLIKTLQESKENMTADNIKKYRLITLRVIQEILQWKQQFQSSYHELTKIKPKLTFTLNGQNYLLKISRSFKLEHTAESFEGNTFLLGYEENTVDNDFLVKIRACQMLLLQNDLETEPQ